MATRTVYKFEFDTFSHCINIEGKTQFFGAPLAQGHAIFFGWDLMMGFGKPHKPANFEVDIFSRCRKLKKNRKILGNYPRPGPHPLFFCV